MKIFSDKIIHVFIITFISTPLLAGNLSETHISLDTPQLTLTRNSGKSITYLYDNGGTANVVDNDTSLDTTNNFTNIEPGYRISASNKLSASWSINAQFVNNNMYESRSFKDTNGQLEIFQLSLTENFDSAHSVQASYKSDFDADEVSAIYNFSNNVDFILGFGYMTFVERMEIFSDDTGAGATGIGTYTILTENLLIGLHAGLALNFKPTNNTGVYLIGKVGYYNNGANQSQKVTDVSFQRTNRGSINEISTVTELRMGVSYFYSKEISLNLGYQAFNISNIALAETHFNTTSAGINNVLANDSLEWSGISIGFNYIF